MHFLFLRQICCIIILNVVEVADKITDILPAYPAEICQANDDTSRLTG